MQNIEVNSTKQIRLGTVVSYLGIMVNIVLGLIYTPWMIKEIGQSDYALYTLATSIITMFTVDFGMSAAVSRFVSKYRAESNEDAINNFLGLVYKLYMIISAIVLIALIIVYFMLDTIYISLTPEELSKFKVIFVIAASFSIISFPFVPLNGILNAYENFVGLKVCDLINKVGSVVIIAPVLIMGGGLYELVVINAAVGLITIVIKLILTHRKTTVHVNFKYFSVSMLKEIFSYSIWSTVGSLAQNFLLTITPSILAIVSDSKEVAVFGFANSIGTYVYTLAMGIDGFFLPRVSRMVVQKDNSDSFLQLMIRVGRFQLYILGLIFIGFILVGRDFVSLLMGKDYQMAYYCVICYFIYSVICYPQQIANTMVVAVNKVKERALISIVAAVINVGLSFILSRIWGAVGACISICMAILIRTVLLNILYQTKLHLNILKYFRDCHLSLLPSLLIAGGVSVGIIRFFPNLSWANFCIKVGCITGVYIVSVVLLGMNKEEKNLVKVFFRKRSRF